MSHNVAEAVVIGQVPSLVARISGHTTELERLNAVIDNQFALLHRRKQQNKELLNAQHQWREKVAAQATEIAELQRELSVKNHRINSLAKQVEQLQDSLSVEAAADK